MNLQPYSSKILALCGLALIGMGLYFVFLRPPLLPEDTRYMGAVLPEVRVAVPRLLVWLDKVFWVMGGFVFATGLLTLYVAATLFPSRANGSLIIVALTGLTSVGWMAVTNFVIGSDFRWPLLGLASLWGFTLVLGWLEAGNEHRSRPPGEDADA